MAVAPKIDMSTFGEVKIEAPSHQRLSAKGVSSVVVKWQSGTNTVALYSSGGGGHVNMHVEQLAWLVELAPQIIASASSDTPRVADC